MYKLVLVTLLGLVSAADYASRPLTRIRLTTPVELGNYKWNACATPAAQNETSPYFFSIPNTSTNQTADNENCFTSLSRFVYARRDLPNRAEGVLVWAPTTNGRERPHELLKTNATYCLYPQATEEDPTVYGLGLRKCISARKSSQVQLDLKQNLVWMYFNNQMYCIRASTNETVPRRMLTLALNCTAIPDTVAVNPYVLP